MIQFFQNIVEAVGSIGVELLVFACVFAFVEKINPIEKKTPLITKDSKTEILLAVLNVGIVAPIIAFAASYIAPYMLSDVLPHRIFEAQILMLPLWAQIVLGAFIVDFGTYWRHRFTHMFMWRYHSIHHSAQQLTWLTGLRLHPVDFIVAVLIDAAVLYVLGFGGEGIFGALLFVKFFNYFAHANINVKFKRPLCYLLVSPHFHRWHHANQKEAYDKNFCAVFPLWDVIFGTYYYPENSLPKKYGISKSEQARYKPGIIGSLIYPFQKKR